MGFEIDWKGQRYLMEWSSETDFESLDNVVQAYGFIFDETGKICVVDCNKGYWSLPGGKPEGDETFEETFIREVDEEADLDIKNIERLGCFRVTPLSENCDRGVHHILRFIAEVERIKEQTVDPAEGAIAIRDFVEAEKFSEVVKWGESGELQLRRALEMRVGAQ